MQHGILMHDPNDDVGVTVVDLKTGQTIGAVTLEGEPVVSIEIMEDIPLSHKVAIKEIEKNKIVLEYGREIGQATKRIACGEHVHTHNLKTIRW